MDSSNCRDLPVSGDKMQRSSSEIEFSRAPIKPFPSCPFMEDTHLDPIERRNESLNELFRACVLRDLHIDCLRRDIMKQGKKPTQRKDVLDRFNLLIASIHRTKTQLHYLSVMKHRTAHRRRMKLPLPRNIRQIMEEDSQNNLCQAVQGMHLNSESSVRKSECIPLSKIESPSEVAEDLSKLCMKD